MKQKIDGDMKEDMHGQFLVNALYCVWFREYVVLMNIALS